MQVILVCKFEMDTQDAVHTLCHKARNKPIALNH